jgi:hypothetical protein
MQILEISPSVIKLAQEFVDTRKVNLSMATLARVYTTRMKQLPETTKTVTIGDYVFATLSPQEGIAADTQLLALLNDYRDYLILKFRNSIKRIAAEVLEEVRDLYGASFEGELNDVLIIVDGCVEGKTVDEIVKESVFPAGVVSSLLALLAERKSETGRILANEIGDIHILLFFAATRQVAGPPIDDLTQFLLTESQLENLRKFSAEELGKLQKDYRPAQPSLEETLIP